MRRWMLGGFVAVTLVMSACSDGDKKDDKEASGTRKDYVAAFKPGAASMGMTDEQATCVAEATVDILGVDQLNKVTSPREIKNQTSSFDMSSFGLTEEQGGELYDKFDACVDVFQMMIGQGQDPAMVDCLSQTVTEDMLRSAMIPLFMGSADATSGNAATELNNAYNSCQTQVAPTATTLPSPPTSP